MHTDDPMARKRAIRADHLARRRATPAAERAAADAALLAALTRHLDGVTVVAAYAPVGAEPGGPDLPRVLQAAGMQVLLPVLEPDNDLDWAVFDGDLVPGLRGTVQPGGPRLGRGAVGNAGAMLVPAVAVDGRGVRLGRGGGSYDRALSRLGAAAHTTATRVTALLYEGELVDRLPEEPHDRRVGAVVTPRGVRLLAPRAGTGRTATPSTG